MTKPDPRGNCEHNVWVEKAGDIIAGGHGARRTTTIVGMANNNDEYHWQSFRSREEVEALIGKLRAAADEGWPDYRRDTDK